MSVLPTAQKSALAENQSSIPINLYLAALGDIDIIWLLLVSKHLVGIQLLTH